MTSTVIWTLFAFACGALPFAVWIGKWGAQKNIQAVGDGNPGATNAFKAGGIKWGALAFIFEICKGAVPVGLAHYIFGISGGALVPIAVAPTLGHAFSPFLNFKGGKALAATFGSWIGLTLIEVPSLMVVMILIFFATIAVDGWSVMFTLFAVALHLWINHPDSALLTILGLQTVVIIYKHLEDLSQVPRLRPWLRQRLNLAH